jgi:hypothetical protein
VARARAALPADLEDASHRREVIASALGRDRSKVVQFIAAILFPEIFFDMTNLMARAFCGGILKANSRTFKYGINFALSSALSLCINGSSATGDFAHGTYAAMYYSTDFAIVAIDSRVSDIDGNVLSDKECKIYPISEHTLFFGIGMNNIPVPGGITTVDLVKRARSETGNSDDPIALADKWVMLTETILKSIPLTWKTRILDHLKQDIENNPEHAIVTGTFMGSRLDGDIAVVMAAIRFDQDEGDITISHKITEATDNTTYSFRSEKSYRQFNRALNERQEEIQRLAKSPFTRISREAAYLEALVRYIITQGGDVTVGGKPTVVTLQRGQTFEWTRHPAFCP